MKKIFALFFAFCLVAISSNVCKADDFSCKEKDNCGIAYGRIYLSSEFEMILMQEDSGRKFPVFAETYPRDQENESCNGIRGIMMYQSKTIKPVKVKDPLTGKDLKITKIIRKCVAPG